VRVLVLHGPNLNLLGTREPSLYGRASLSALDEQLSKLALTLGVTLDVAQSNHEGVLLDRLHAAAADGTAGVILNAGAYAHTSLALADGVRAVAPLPVVEVHLTNTAGREAERQRALVGAACAGRIEGFGPLSYELALRALVEMLQTEPQSAEPQ